MRLRTQRRLAYWLFTFAIVAIVYSIVKYDFGVSLGDMYSERYGDKLERSLKEVAGPDAFNCGRIKVPKGVPLENACAPAADAQHHNFLVSYEIQTPSGTLYRGIARSVGGTYAEFRWQPGSELRTIWGGPDPTPVPCTTSLRTTWQGVATCTDER